MAPQRLLALVNGLRTMVVPATSSTGAAQAGQVPALNAAGLIDPTMIAPTQLNTSGSTPTFTQNTTGLGSASTVTVAGNDVAGTIVIVAGSGCGTGPTTLGSMAFAGTHTSAPRAVLVTGANSNAGRTPAADKASWSATGWNLLMLSANALTSGTTYSYAYLVIW